MKRRFDIKKRTENKNLLFMILMVGMIVVLLFAYSSQFPKMQELFDDGYKNINVTFFDHSIDKLNPSGKVKIDGKVVYQIDSISKCLYQDREINLKKGRHIIEISTIDDQYKLIDTIEVVKYPMKYKLRIQFNYNPPVDEYKQVVINHIFNRSIKEKEYTQDQRQSLLEQVTEKINQEFDNSITYNPRDPYFTFSFITHYHIE